MTNVEDNIKLVYFVVNKKYKDIKERDDLIQEGMIGLFKATKNYEENKGVKFSTFATRCIDNEIKMYLRKQKRHNYIVFSELEQFQIDELNNVSFDDNPLLQENLKRFLSMLDARENKIFYYLLQGYTQKDICNIEKVSQSLVSRVVRRIKHKYKFLLF